MFIPFILRAILGCHLDFVQDSEATLIDIATTLVAPAVDIEFTGLAELDEDSLNLGLASDRIPVDHPSGESLGIVGNVFPVDT